MNRGMGLVLGALVIAAALFAGWVGSTRKTYFDPRLYQGSYPCTLDYSGARGPVEREIESWFAAPLRKVDEPSLYLDRPNADETTLRLTFMPSFGEPIIVRIEDLYGDRPHLIATRVTDQVVVREGPDRLARDLSRAEVEPLIAFLASTRVLNLPPDSCLSGVDGHIFLIEANGPGGYRFINRWGVSEGPVHELGNLMFRLTGWPNGRYGPDRSADNLNRGTGPDGRPWPRPDLTPAPET